MQKAQGKQVCMSTALQACTKQMRPAHFSTHAAAAVLVRQGFAPLRRGALAARCASAAPTEGGSHHAQRLKSVTPAAATGLLAASHQENKTVQLHIILACSSRPAAGGRLAE